MIFSMWSKTKTRIGRSSAPLSVNGTMLTHTGCVRELNEDVVAYRLPARGGSVKEDMLALVADGMGGHAAGEVASALAAETIFNTYFAQNGSPAQRLTASLTNANKAIFDRGQSDPACNGMGTTCTILAIRDDQVFLGHVGDSRAYLLRDGKLRQISEDHSLVGQMVRDGLLTKEQAAKSPDRNIILRSLGNQPRVEPAVFRDGMQLNAGDVLLLCSDGLSDVVTDNVIETATRDLPPFEACQSLIESALTAGAPDNVSVGVFSVSADPTPASDAVRTTRPMVAPVNGAES
jgi:serine/threonine protein phosphatase PrpC